MEDNKRDEYLSKDPNHAYNTAIPLWDNLCWFEDKPFLRSLAACDEIKLMVLLAYIPTSG